MLCAMQTMDPLVAAELRRARNALSSVIGSRPVAKPPRPDRCNVERWRVGVSDCDAFIQPTQPHAETHQPNADCDEERIAHSQRVTACR